MRRRRGVALLVVLSVISGITALGMVANIAARSAVATSINRIALTRGYWFAEGCASEVIAQMEEWLAAAPTTRWSWMDSSLAQQAPSLATEAWNSAEVECRVALRPSGMSLDVNGAARPQIAALLEGAGMPPADGSSLARAIVDWRDEDDVETSGFGGSESEWYIGAGRVPPRNSTFASSQEIRLVRGADALPGVDTLLGVGDGLVVLSRAPAAVLAGLPGMSAEAVQAIVEARRETPYPEIATIAARLGNEARARLQAMLPALRQQSVTLPSTWLLTVSWSQSSGPEATLELLLARDALRIAIVRRRSWP